jgi:transient receptor potential cation channel subfamily V protein 5
VSSCFLRDQWQNTQSPWHKAAETLVVITSILYVIMFALNWKRIGTVAFGETMRIEPGRAMFLVSCILIPLCVPFRLLCLPSIEERLVAVAMFLTPMHILYFFRGFKSVGPFVVMIYKMLISDLLCFVLIYFVFLLSYAQAFFVIFRSHVGESINYFGGASESVLSMFLMSLLEFGDVFEQFDHTDHPTLARMLFVSYSILVAVMLMNMLIAMMGKTYQEIASRPNEWLRQWARIVLIVERTLNDRERQLLQEAYTDVRDGRRVFLSTIRLNPQQQETIQQANHLKQTNRQLRSVNVWRTTDD